MIKKKHRILNYKTRHCQKTKSIRFFVQQISRMTNCQLIYVKVNVKGYKIVADFLRKRFPYITNNSINFCVTTPCFIRPGQKQWMKEYLNKLPKSIFPSYWLTTTLLHRDPWLCYLIITLCRHFIIVVVVICSVRGLEASNSDFLSLFITRATYHYRYILSNALQRADLSRRTIKNLKTDFNFS